MDRQAMANSALGVAHFFSEATADASTAEAMQSYEFKEAFAKAFAFDPVAALNALIAWVTQNIGTIQSIADLVKKAVELFNNIFNPPAPSA